VKGFVASDSLRAVVHRTSLLLVAYMVVHAAGNALFLLPAPARDAVLQHPFNVYARTLRASPLGLVIRAIEVYLLVAGVAHALVASFISLRYGKLTQTSGGAAGWWASARLQLTGSAVTGFLCLHLLHFRFPQVLYGAAGAAAHAAEARGERDLYGEVIERLREPWAVPVYVAGTVAAGYHLGVGWQKAVLKFVEGASPERRALAPLAVAIGQALAALITTVLLAATLTAFQRGGGGGGGGGAKA
jgi:succinate dehydrogenase/fumarate reductase cytochrome b subunit